MAVKSALEKLNALILLCMFCITTLTVIFRSVLSTPASWSEDLAQLSFILLVFVGAATVMEDEGHIRITTLVDRFGPRTRRAIRIVNRLLMITFMVLFAKGAWTNAMFNWEVDLGTVDWIQIGHMYMSLFVCSLLMMLYLTLNIVRDIKGTYQQSDRLNATI